MVEEKGDVRVNANYLSFVYESVTSSIPPCLVCPVQNFSSPHLNHYFSLRRGWAIGDPMGRSQDAYRMTHRINIPPTIKNSIDDEWFFYPIECKKD
jgi:hypothetical protein